MGLPVDAPDAQARTHGRQTYAYAQARPGARLHDEGHDGAYRAGVQNQEELSDGARGTAVQADGPQRRQSAGIPTGEVLQGMEHTQRQARIHRGHHRYRQPQEQEGAPSKGHRGDCDDDERQSAAEIQGWDKGLLQEMTLMKGGVSKRRILFFYKQSPDFHKPGLCHVQKILYL